VSPFELGFVQSPAAALAAADNAADIALTFFVAYADRRTTRGGSRGWRSTSPPPCPRTQLPRRILPPQARSYNFFGMLRLWRLRRVGALFAEYVPELWHCLTRTL
jgi:potassium channel